LIAVPKGSQRLDVKVEKKDEMKVVRKSQERLRASNRLWNMCNEP